MCEGIHMFHPVKAPKHYAGNGEIECKDALASMLYDAESRLPSTAIYWWGCAFKYLWRWPWKNGKQDIAKCRQCLDYLEKELEGGKIEIGEDQAG